MAGHELHAERPDLVIVDEPARAQQLVEAPQGPPVLCLVEAAAVPSLPEGIEDFVVVPASAGELAHRVARIDHRARLAERQRLLSTAIEASPHAVEICDASSRLQYVNTAFTRILGYTLEEVRGRTPASVFRSDQHDAAYFRAIERALEAGQASPR